MTGYVKKEVATGYSRSSFVLPSGIETDIPIGISYLSSKDAFKLRLGGVMYIMVSHPKLTMAEKLLKVMRKYLEVVIKENVLPGLHQKSGNIAPGISVCPVLISGQYYDQMNVTTPDPETGLSVVTKKSLGRTGEVFPGYDREIGRAVEFRKRAVEVFKNNLIVMVKRSIEVLETYLKAPAEPLIDPLVAVRKVNDGLYGLDIQVGDVYIRVPHGVYEIKHDGFMSTFRLYVSGMGLNITSNQRPSRLASLRNLLLMYKHALETGTRTPRFREVGSGTLPHAGISHSHERSKDIIILRLYCGYPCPKTGKYKTKSVSLGELTTESVKYKETLAELIAFRKEMVNTYRLNLLAITNEAIKELNTLGVS